MASLYDAQLSPTTAFNSVYMGSKSSRGTEISAFVVFWVGGGADGTVLTGGIDVEAVVSVPVNAAGSICIVTGQSGRVGCAKPEES